MDLNTFKEYIQLHIISLEQDLEQISIEMELFEEMESNEYHALDIEYNHTTGQLDATRHLLSVLTDMIKS